jgi:hypothetical protein
VTISDIESSLREPWEQTDREIDLDHHLEPMITPPTATAVSIPDEASKAIAGAYDLHVHVAPDVIGRRIDDIDLAHEFLERWLKGFILKSHYVPTAERAKVVTKAVPGIAAFGAITLNHSVGGLNRSRWKLPGARAVNLSGCQLWMRKTRLRGCLAAAKRSCRFGPRFNANLPPWGFAAAHAGNWW